jgi:hypothetical protein
MLRNANDVTAAMKPHFTPAATSMTSATAIDEANVGQPAEIDAKAIQTLDRQTSDRPPAVPRKTLREWLRRLLLLLFPNELDAKAIQTLGRQTSDRPPAVPGKTLRERLRRPLLILFPILLAGVGAAYYLAE